ncbi:hypothetical protein HYX58_02980 [Candidatus Dependentiae bacterium]|nr:hypothetical protein [Candidatus Dependentiae bacterium]
MNSELVVNFDYKNIQQVRMIIPVMVVLWFLVDSIQEPCLSFLPIIVIKFVIISCLVLLSLGSIYYFVLTRKNEPAAVLNNDGIWIIHHGFISWENISDICMHQALGAPLPIVAVNVRDPKAISAQSSFGGKCVLFWSKLFGYPHIFLANIDIENELVISFSKRYITSKNSV